MFWAHRRSILTMIAAWYQERGAGVEPGGIAGRSWYTSLGHCVEIWSVSQVVVPCNSLGSLSSGRTLLRTRFGRDNLDARVKDHASF